MVWRQVWREADVRRQTSVLPHLTVWRQVRQLRTQGGGCVPWTVGRDNHSTDVRIYVWRRVVRLVLNQTKMGPWKLVFKDQFTGGLNQINTVFRNLSTNWILALRSQWWEEQVEMWMWGGKIIRTVRSWIRICGHHMVSETSAPRFVFRSRESPVCRTECVKVQFHVQSEEPERTIIDGGFSCFWSVNTKVHVCHQECVWRRIVVGCQPRTIC